MSCPTLCDLMNCSSPGFPVLTTYQSLLKLVSIELVMHLTVSFSAVPFSFCLHSFPASGSFPVSWLFASGHWNIGASASVFPVNVQGWFPLGLTGFWSLCCWRDFQESSPAPQFESINSLALSLLYCPTLTSVHDYWKNHAFNFMHLCRQCDVSAF